MKPIDSATPVTKINGEIMLDHNIKTDIVSISPEYATQLLERNTHNRVLNINRAKKISNAILRGEWQLNGDAIRLSRSGVLLDGQHRLKAIEMAGVEVKSILITGLDDEVFNTIDTNARPRSASDILHLNGSLNAVNLASAAKLYFNWCASNKTSVYLGNDKSPTPTQIFDLVKQNPELGDWVRKSRSAQKMCGPSVIAFCFYVFSLHDKTKANEFFDRLVTGAGLSQNDPALKLREFLFEAKASRNSFMPHVLAAYIFKAFKMYLLGAEVKMLRVRTGGDMPEKNLYVL